LQFCRWGILTRPQVGDFKVAIRASQQKDDLEVIIDEIGDLESLVRSVLEYSRPDRMKAVKVSPSEIVNKVIHLVEPELKFHRIKLQHYRSCWLPETWIDCEQLKEALINMIINSSEAIKKDNGCISIVEKKLNQESIGSAAVIEIHDNGDGIPEHVRDKIFEPYFSTKAEGCGLGLCITKQFIEAQGGQLLVSSK
jgi:nitrogen-specific signal transduction histidine kinase